MSDNKQVSSLDEWAKESGLTKDEWLLEKIVDKIKAASTLEGIKILEQWQSQQTKPTGLSKDEILSPLISKMGYSLENIQSVTGFANDFLNVCYKAMEKYRNAEETKPVEEANNISIDLVLSILNENYNAAKDMVDEDKKRSSQEMVIETYEDLIAIFSGKIKNIPANIDSNPMAFYNPAYPKSQTQKPVSEEGEVDNPLPKCTDKNCNLDAIGDYNGHGAYACEYHMRKWNNEFDEDYK